MYGSLVASVFLLAIVLASPGAVAQQGQSVPQYGSATPSDPFSDTLGSITGTIQTADGHPVANANIEVREVEHPTRTFIAQSNASGAFAIFNLEPGSYEVIATSGVDEAHDRVEVNGNLGLTSVNLRMGGTHAGHPATRGTVSLSQFTVPAKARALFENAVQSMNRGNPGDCLKKLNAALAIAPKFTEARTMRGVLQENAGNNSAATADFQQAIQDDPNYPYSYLALAALFNNGGRYGDSLPILAIAQRLAPDAWQTYFELSRANIEKGDYLSALHLLDRGAELQGGSSKEVPELHMARSFALIGLNRIPEALHELETYLALSPTGAHADQARRVLEELRATEVTATR
jgi:Tfp pilus assembly protein PilF